VSALGQAANGLFMITHHHPVHLSRSSHISLGLQMMVTSIQNSHCPEKLIGWTAGPAPLEILI